MISWAGHIMSEVVTMMNEIRKKKIIAGWHRESPAKKPMVEVISTIGTKGRSARAQERQLKLNDCLIEAVDYHSIELVEMLLDLGAEATASERGPGRSNTALVNAIAEQQPEIAKLLIERGADVNSWCDYEGYVNTALGMAVENGYVEIVRLLIEKGADPTKDNGAGKCPLDFAETKPAGLDWVEEMKDLLRSAIRLRGKPSNEMKMRITSVLTAWSGAPGNPSKSDNAAQQASIARKQIAEMLVHLIKGDFASAAKANKGAWADMSDAGYDGEDRHNGYSLNDLRKALQAVDNIAGGKIVSEDFLKE